MDKDQLCKVLKQAFEAGICRDNLVKDADPERFVADVLENPDLVLDIMHVLAIELRLTIGDSKPTRGPKRPITGLVRNITSFPIVFYDVEPGSVHHKRGMQERTHSRNEQSFINIAGMSLQGTVAYSYLQLFWRTAFAAMHLTSEEIFHRVGHSIVAPDAIELTYMTKRQEPEVPHITVAPDPLSPIYPGEHLIDFFIETPELTPEILAEKSGIDLALLTDILENKARITAEISLRLDRYFGISDGMYLRLQYFYDRACRGLRELNHDFSKDEAYVTELATALADPGLQTSLNAIISCGRTPD